jgi:tetratricopeptide (TPR) repeat protein
MRAYAAIRLGNFEVAEADCAKQKELQSEHPYLQALAGDLHMAKGTSEHAIDAYRAALASDAEVLLRFGLQMRWRFALGLALLLSGRLEEAKTEYSEAIRELNPLETELAGHELDHWTARKSVAPEAIRSIRRLLGVEPDKVVGA